MTRAEDKRSWASRLGGGGAFIAVTVVAGLSGCGGQSQEHTLVVTVPEATNVVTGQVIRMAGADVGSVGSLTPVNGGRAARIELRLDDRAWPVRRGTKMALRWGGTVSYGNRYVTLDPPARGGTRLAEGATFPTRDFYLPVEFDSFLSAFSKPVRADLRRMLTNSSASLVAAEPALKSALHKAPPALSQASFVLQDLTDDEASLRTLVRSGDQVLTAVDQAQPGLRQLLHGASTTFQALGDQADGVKATLQGAPATLTAARDTLRRADGTLTLADDVVTRLKPGVGELRRIATPLSRVLTTVADVGPDARTTLASVRAATPKLNPLLTRAKRLSPQLEDIGGQAVENLKCIRPYTPDIVAFFTNWGDATTWNDGKDRMFRAQIQNFMPAPVNGSPLNAGQAKKLFPGMEYGFPRPPGTNAGQPWFLPECGAGPDALDPNKDPEARPFSQVMHIPELSKTEGSR